MAREGWSEPQHLAAVNSETNEWFPTRSPTTEIFTSVRNDRAVKEIRISMFGLVDGKYQTPENLHELINTAANEVEPFIAPDQSYIIFAGTGLPESRGAYDLSVSFRRDSVWTKPTNLGDKINSVGWDFSTESFA